MSLTCQVSDIFFLLNWKAERCHCVQKMSLTCETNGCHSSSSSIPKVLLKVKLSSLYILFKGYHVLSSLAHCRYRTGCYKLYSEIMGATMTPSSSNGASTTPSCPCHWSSVDSCNSETCTCSYNIHNGVRYLYMHGSNLQSHIYTTQECAYLHCIPR